LSAGAHHVSTAQFGQLLTERWLADAGRCFDLADIMLTS